MKHSKLLYFVLFVFGATIVGCNLGTATDNDSGKHGTSTQKKKVHNEDAAVESNHAAGDAVQVQQLKEVPWSGEIEIMGKALAKRESVLSLGVSGMVKQITVQRGDRVKKGDVLLKLDRTGFVLGVDQAQAALAGAVAQEELLKIETVRLNQLLAEGAAPSASRDELTAQSRGVDAQVRVAGTNVSMAKKRLKDAVLRAPYNGVVADILIEKGEQASATPPKMLMKIVDSATLEVQVFVPEKAANKVQQGETATVTIDATGNVTEGKIVFVSNTIDPGARTFEVRIEVDNADYSIKAGAFARVQLKSEANGEAIFVPVGSVLRDDNNRPYVFVVGNRGKDKIAKQRPVTLGAVEGARVRLEKGVVAGEQLIVSNTSQLTDNQQITIKVNAQN